MMKDDTEASKGFGIPFPLIQSNLLCLFRSSPWKSYFQKGGMGFGHIPSQNEPYEAHRGFWGHSGLKPRVQKSILSFENLSFLQLGWSSIHSWNTLSSSFRGLLRPRYFTPEIEETPKHLHQKPLRKWGGHRQMTVGVQQIQIRRHGGTCFSWKMLI